jgi:hypothetical protein
MSTYRPSPSLKSEVSRNIVGVTEVVPNNQNKASGMQFTYTEAQSCSIQLILIFIIEK